MCQQKLSHLLRIACWVALGFAPWTSAFSGTNPTTVYAGTNSPAVATMTMVNIKTTGSGVQGTLQLTNITGTWIAVYTDPNDHGSVAYPGPVPDLVAPFATRSFDNFPLNDGDHIQVIATTPKGLDFSQPNQVAVDLMGAVFFDLVTRANGFDLPEDTFQQSSASGTVSTVAIAAAASWASGVVSTKSSAPFVLTDSTKASDIAHDVTAYLTNSSNYSLLVTNLKPYISSKNLQDVLDDKDGLATLIGTSISFTTLETGILTAPASSRAIVRASSVGVPALSSVSPTTIRNHAPNTSCTLTFHGSGFTKNTTLNFSQDPAGPFATDPSRLRYIDSSTIEYDFQVGSTSATWFASIPDANGTLAITVIPGDSTPHLLLPEAGPNGVISPGDVQTVISGGSFTFVATPRDSSYIVEQWYVDGTPTLCRANRFTVSDVVTSHTISVKFERTGPTNLRATAASAKQIDLSWEDESLIQLGYYLERTTNTSGPWVTIQALDPASRTYADKSLAAGTTYLYRIRGYNIASTTEYSNTASATTVALSDSTPTLAISSTPNSGIGVLWGTLSGSATVDTPASVSFAPGERVTLVAPDTANGCPFVKWTIDGADAGAQTSLYLKMDVSRSVAAVYASSTATRELTALSINGPSTVPAGATSTFTATAQFSDGLTSHVLPVWAPVENGAPASLDANGTLTTGSVTANTIVYIQASYSVAGITKTALATATILPTDSTEVYNLTTNVSGGVGAIASTPSQPTFSSGSKVTLSAIPATYYKFAGWGLDGAIFGTASSITLVMDSDKHVTASFTYDPGYFGSVTVVLTPSAVAAAGGKWRLDEGPWMASGATVTPNLNGVHYVYFTNVPGYGAPATKQINVQSGVSQSVTGAYTSNLQPGGIQLTIGPQAAVAAGAKWRVKGDNSAWQGSGATLIGLPAATYQIEFQSVSGWNPPVVGGIPVTDGNTAILTAEYAPSSGAPEIYAIGPSAGPIAGGTDVTISGANFVAPVAVTFGGKDATSVTVVDTSHVIARTPVGESFRTVDVSLNASGGNTSVANGFTYANPRGQHIDLVGQIGGTVNSVAVSGSYLYGAQGGGLVIYDVTNWSSPAPVGRIALPGMANDVAVSGNYAYVADNDAGLVIVDVTSKTAPKIAGGYQTTALANGIAFQSGIAYVANDVGGLTLFDCTDPTAPTLLKNLSLNGQCVRVALLAQDTKLYACVAAMDSGMHVVDVTDKMAAWSSTYPTRSSVQDVSVAGTVAYLACSGSSDGLSIVDLSAPAAPTLLGKLADSGSAVTVYAGLAYLCVPQKMEIVSVANPVIPQVLGQSPSIGTYKKIVLTGGNAVIAQGETGFRVVSIGGAAHPAQLAQPSGLFGCQDISVNGAQLYAAGGNGGFSAIDASTPAQPNVVGHLDFSGASCQSVANVGPNVFLAVPGTGIASVRVDQSGVHPMAIFVQSNPSRLFCDSSSLIAADTYQFTSPSCPRVFWLSTADPSALLVQGQIINYSAAGRATCAIELGTRAYFADSTGVHVLDLPVPATPQRMGDIVLPSTPLGLAASSDGKYLFTANGASAGMSVIDVSDGYNPKLITTAIPTAGVADVIVSNSLAFTSCYGLGVCVFDISDPTHPTLVANYKTAGAAWSAKVSGNLIYVADSIGGVSVLRLLDYQPPTLRISTPDPTGALSNSTGLLDVSGTASDDSGTVTVKWSNDVGGGGTITGTTSWTVSSLPLAAGVNTITFTASDPSGNTASATLIVNYQPSDVTPPVLSITQPTTAPSIEVSTPTLTIGGTALDNSQRVASVTWSNDRGGSGGAVGASAWNIADIPLKEGPNVITVTATDGSANKTSSVLRVLYSPPDTVPPALSIDFPTTSSSYQTGQGAIELSGTVADDRTVSSVTWANSAGGNGTADGTNLWSASGITLQPGLNILTVTAQDGAGNSTSTSIAVTYTVPPVVTSATAASGNVGKAFSYQLTASNSPRLMSVDGLPQGLSFDSKTGVISGVPVSPGSAQIILGASNDGGPGTSVLTLNIGAADYHGVYFGSFSAGTGYWALNVNPDSSGKFIAYFPERHSAIVSKLVVDKTGAFSTRGTEIVPTSAAITRSLTAQSYGSSEIHPRAASDFTLSGMIGPDGSLTGTVDGIGLTFSGTQDSPSGTNPYSGSYRTVALGTATEDIYTIVGPSGQVFTVITGSIVTDGGTGTIDSTGQIALTTSTGTKLDLSVTSPNGSVVGSLLVPGYSSSVPLMGLPDSVTSGAHLVNISTRAQSGVGDNVAIGGFVVAGTSPKKFLIRAVGPSLTTQGIPGDEVMLDPTIELHVGVTPAILAKNDNWTDDGNGTDITSAGTAIGARPTDPNDANSSALLISLAPGVYSFIAQGRAQTSGVELIEVYDAEPLNSTSKLVNISARARASLGDAVAIGGFVVTGNAPKRLLVRAVGPTLATQGVPDSEILADPVIVVHDAVNGNVVIATNDNWTDNPNSAEILQTAARVGATPLSSADHTSSALLLTLRQGVYSFVASGKSQTSGIVLVEVYDAD